MKTEQLIIADWMQRQMDRTGWSAVDWARRAEIAPTTITRAMHPSFDSVTTVPVLDKLARAAGVESVLDVLART